MSTKQFMNTEMNNDEHMYWNEMKIALRKHNSYTVRKAFYPHNMDAWENEHREIEKSYRINLNEMISKRRQFEMEEEQRENEKLAADALLLLKKREEKKNLKIAKKLENMNNISSNNVRRSLRLANKK